jgi:glutathione synthase/RimK-type ligase-like ATP-grasp enzyme
MDANGRRAQLRELTSVWWRKPGWHTFADDLQPQEREFAMEETEHCMWGLWSALDCFWVSHPENIRRAGYKIEQLRRAARLGFPVPRTVVTTDPDTARAFFDECAGRMVYKVLSDPYLSAQRMIRAGWTDPIPVRSVPTTPITPQNLHLLDNVRSVPCLFQELVDKQSELRVTVIGAEVFAVEILSQEHEQTRVDWRHANPQLRLRVAQLPDDLAARCVELTRSYGLNFSAIDLILTPDGEHVFLEINPNGQFLFLQERLPELRLDEAMATMLRDGGNG